MYSQYYAPLWEKKAPVYKQSNELGQDGKGGNERHS